MTSPPVGDDHDVVDGLGDLGEQVARDQHGAASVGEGAQELPQPVDALRIEAVRRLVEDQHLRLAEQGARQTEALTHSEREALDPAVPDVGEVDLAEHLVDARERETCGGRQDAKVIARPPTGMEGVRLEHCPDVAERLRRAPRSGLPPIVALPRLGRTRPSSIRSVVVLPAPLGPRKPVTAPSRAVKLRSSTAATSPKRFESP